MNNVPQLFLKYRFNVLLYYNFKFELNIKFDQNIEIINELKFCEFDRTYNYCKTNNLCKHLLLTHNNIIEHLFWLTLYINNTNNFSSNYKKMNWFIAIEHIVSSICLQFDSNKFRLD